MHINEIAAKVPADVAQLAVARVLVALGSEQNWSADTLDEIATAVAPAIPAGLPSVFDQDEAAEDFWRGVGG